MSIRLYQSADAYKEKIKHPQFLKVNPFWYLTPGARFHVGDPPYCPKGSPSRIGGCRARLWRSANNSASLWCSDCHGLVYYGPFEGIYVEFSHGAVLEQLNHLGVAREI